jgi:hypothetical protein
MDERLTEKDYRALLVGAKIRYRDNSEMTEALNTAITLFDAKAEGRLIVLPCKVGQMVWVIKDGKIDEGFVKWFDTGDPLNPQWTAAIQDVPRGPVFVPIESVYITREEAEKALEGIEE